MSGAGLCRGKLAPMTTLVIGGAGYIGSHVVRLLLEKGERVVVVDSLITGKEERTAGAELVQIDITLPDASEKLASHLRASGADSVIHLAAHKQVGESVVEPEMYWHDNVLDLGRAPGRERV